MREGALTAKITFMADSEFLYEEVPPVAHPGINEAHTRNNYQDLFVNCFANWN